MPRCRFKAEARLGLATPASPFIDEATEAAAWARGRVQTAQEDSSGKPAPRPRWTCRRLLGRVLGIQLCPFLGVDWMWLCYPMDTPRVWRCPARCMKPTVCCPWSPCPMALAPKPGIYLLAKEGGEKNHHFVNPPKHSLHVHHRSVSLPAVFCGIVQICCLTITDNHSWAGQVDAHWPLASLVKGQNGKRSEFTGWKCSTCFLSENI